MQTFYEMNQHKFTDAQDDPDNRTGSEPVDEMSVHDIEKNLKDAQVALNSIDETKLEFRKNLEEWQVPASMSSEV